jgi:hypothetical protein
MEGGSKVLNYLLPLPLSFDLLPFHLISSKMPRSDNLSTSEGPDSVNIFRVAPVVPFFVVPPLKEHLPKTISTPEVVAPLKHCRWFHYQSTKEF